MVVVSVVLTFSSIGNAAPTPAEEELARKLYEEAWKDLNKGDHARACPKFEAALRLTPEHVRTAISLSDCHDKAGRPATALEELAKARVLAEAQGSQAKIAEIDTKVADLNTRVPKIRIEVPKEVAASPGLTVSRNGIPVPVAQWGQPVAVNPGTYEFELSAVGQPTWKTTVQPKAGTKVDVTLNPNWAVPQQPPLETPPIVPAVEPPPKPVDVAPPVSEPKVEPKRPPPVVAPRKRSTKPKARPAVPEVRVESSPMRTLGIVTTVLGSAGALAGLGLGTWAFVKNGESYEGHCDATYCDDKGILLRNEAKAFADVSTVAVIAGGVVALGGIVLMAAAPSRSQGKESRPRASVWVAPGRVELRGQW